MILMSKVKNIKLAEQGGKQIEWAEMQMGSLLKIRERFKKEKPLKGYTIGMALHVTKETAVLVRTLVAGGAKVAITGCNPLSTQDDVAAALAKEGVNVFAWRGETKKEYYENLNKVLDFEPNVTIDDGCDLVTKVHTKRPELIESIAIGTEETTTGIIRLHAMEKEGVLKYPLFAVNDFKTKRLVDNYYGTGQSTIDGILRATNVLLAGKIFVVCGYGPCGKGISMRAKGMGANVIVAEVDPFRALQAHYDGYSVMPIEEAVKIGDIFVTATGNKNVIRPEHMKLLRDGSMVANSGHFDVELDYKGLQKIANKRREIRPCLEEFTLKNNKRIFCLGMGKLVNLVCAEGHPSTVMATSFCGQVLAIEYGVKNKEKLIPKVYTLPEKIDDEIAQLQLDALGIKHDSMTEEMIRYMQSWQEGT